MWTKGILFVLATQFAATLTHAAPRISNISGAAGNDQTLTINDSGFNSKSPAVPLIWDNVESGQFNSAWGNTHDLSVTSSGQRHARSSRSGFLNFTSSDRHGDFTAPGATHQKWYVQYWFKVDSNWDWGTTDFSGSNRFLSNLKIFRLWNPGSTDENFVVAINGWENQAEYVMENVSGEPRRTFMSNIRSRITHGAWHLFQFEFTDNSSVGQSNGEFRAWFDGELMVNQTNLKTREDEAGFKRPFIIGFSNVWEPAGGASDKAPNDFYIDDIYMDNTWARVELGNSSTYDGSTVREIQPVTSWNGSAVQIRVNAGSFNTGNTAYLYITDSNGDVNSSGFPVTIGQSGVGTVNQPPIISAGPDQTLRYSSSLSLSGTAQDDGRPNPPAQLTVTWEKISGPGEVRFGNPASLATSAEFTGIGTYVLRMQVTDGQLTVSDSINVQVEATSGDIPSLAEGSQQVVVKPGENQFAHIPYEVKEAGNVKISISRRTGEEIRVLENGPRDKGVYEVTWDGKNSSGSTVASGLYVMVIKTSAGVVKKKIVLMK